MNSSNSHRYLVRSPQAGPKKAPVLRRLAFLTAFALASQAVVSYGQVNELVNPGFESGASGWSITGAQTYNNHPVIVTPGPTYDNSATGECPQDATAMPVVTHSGNNVGNVFGPFFSNPSFATWYQTVAATPGSTFTSGGWTYASHEDLSGPNLYWYEVDFMNSSGTLLASYESSVVGPLTCGETSPFPLDTWVFMPVTNEMQITGGNNTGTVVGNTGASGIITAPAGTASVRFQAVFENINYAGGSIYMDDLSLNLISGALPPTVSLESLNNLTLCTNTSLTGTVTSSGGTITNVAAVITTSALGSSLSTTVTNNINADTTGLGTATANISLPLSSNVIYHITVLASDNSGNVASATESFDTISPSLVIEATDFNFSGGGFLDTPADGGLFLYAGQVGAEGIDEHKNTGNQSTRAPYRSSDEAVIQVANSVTDNEQKYGTNFAAAEAVELCVDYASSGDWFNYTRTYGAGGSAPAGTYDVYLCLGTSGSGNQAALYQIAGDPTSQQQTTNFDGYFGTSSFAENSWAGYEYVPLTDQYGNLKSITIPAGQQTLRISEIANPNLEYLILMPQAPVLTPSFSFFYPDGTHPFEATNSLTFTVSPANGSNIVSTGISLVLNGTNVTSNPKFTLSQNNGSWIGNFPLGPNAVYTALINVTNTAGLASSLSLNFDTFSSNNFTWEAVDYDFSTNGVGGLFIDNPVPTGDTTLNAFVFATNSYFGFPEDLVGVAVAQPNVDIGWVNVSGQVSDYRQDTASQQPTSDYVRPKFVAAQKEFNDPNIGPFNIGYYTTGSWLNYSRHYPTNDYYIWGRLAGGSAYSGTTMSMVTSGVGTDNQTLQAMGSFADPNASGYQSWHWIPLLDASNNPVVASLGGKETLRVTSGNNLNLEFFMLVPAPPQFKVTPSLASGQLNLSFPTQTGHSYQVLYKASLTSSWAPLGSSISGTGSAVNVSETLTGNQGYYTVTVQ